MRLFTAATASVIALSAWEAVRADAGDFIQKIHASDAAAFHQFGFSIGASGHRAIVSQLRDGGDSTGSAYIFERDTGGTWNQTTKLTPTGGLPDDNFGYTVSMSGEFAIVGAGGPSSGTDPGAAYVFRRHPIGHWPQVAKLVASDGADDDQFGLSVAIDANTAVVGAYRDDDNGNASGSAYIFQHDGSGNWMEEDKLIASDAGAVDQFGWAVDVSGNTAIVGAFSKGTNNVGGAYIFRETSPGNWDQLDVLTHSDAADDDRFGWSVAIDGDVAIVGAVNKDSETGAAYVFHDDGLGNWNEVAKLSASDADAGDAFGFSVDINNRHAIVGAWLDDEHGTRAGAAYLFLDDGSGNWSQLAKITAFDAAEEDNFGRSVSLTDKVAFIGSFEDDDDEPDSGSVYLHTVPEPNSLWLTAIAGMGWMVFRSRNSRGNRTSSARNAI